MIQRPATVSITSIVLDCWRAVKPRYTSSDKVTSAGYTIRTALRRRRQHVGDHAAADFGPRALRSYRVSDTESVEAGVAVV
ncbi:MAG: hypothetical protein AAF328_10455 [Planctomycetota bacterium]